jgi:hypothetical protein
MSAQLEAGRRTEPRENAPVAASNVWDAIGHASFAVLSSVTPQGCPRSSGVVYKALGHRLYVAVAPESWKARHLAADGRVAMTVTVRRGGVLSLVMPIPPATISFHGRAILHAAGAPETLELIERLGALLPPERGSVAVVVEIVPEGEFVTYGIGVPLMKMRDPAVARGRAPAA